MTSQLEINEAWWQELNVRAKKNAEALLAAVTVPGNEGLTRQLAERALENLDVLTESLVDQEGALVEQAQACLRARDKRNWAGGVTPFDAEIEALDGEMHVNQRIRSIVCQRTGFWNVWFSKYG